MPPQPNASSFRHFLQREQLRARARQWSEVQRRLFIEHAIEHLSAESLAKLLAGVEGQRAASDSTEAQPGLLERVTRHVEATRSREYLGEYVTRNRPGEREPGQTAAWVAATSHLFDLALELAAASLDADNAKALRLLCDVVREVDERPDELVVFEDDDCAKLYCGEDVRKAHRLLASI